MKLNLDKSSFTNPNYQYVVMYDAKNVTKPADILELEIIDEETKHKYTLASLLEEKDKEIKELREIIMALKQELKNKTDRLLEIIKALTTETREKGVI